MELSKKKSILAGLFLMVVLVLTGCSGNNSAEPVANNETEQEEISVSLKNTKESLKDLAIYEDLAFLELKDGDDINLAIYSECGLTDNDLNNKFKELGEKISEISSEDWFPYKYVFLDAWNRELGMISSMELTMPDLTTRYHIWYEDETQKETSSQ